jgi:hypothetical protein
MKKIVFACGFLGILGILGIGCGSNKCQALADAIEAKYSECKVDLPTTSTSASAECTDALAKTSECYTPCYQNLDCVVLTDPTNPDAADPAKTPGAAR